MINMLLKRLLQAGFVAWAVGSLTFLMMRLLPGDIAYRIAAGRYGYDFVDLDAAQLVSSELGFDRSPFEQYIAWMWDLLHLNLGNSLVSGEPVVESVVHHLGYSVALALCAIAISLLIAFPVGVHCGKHPGGWLDRLSVSLSVFLRSAPVFVVGLVLIILFALHLGWFPVSGFGRPEHIALPSIALALTLAALSNRMIKNEAYGVFRSTYYRFARYKGLSESRAYERHARLNIALPIIAFLGVQTVGLIEGIVMIESLFSWPGIGHALTHAIFARDIPVIQGAALMMGLMFVFINTAVDVCHYVFDPRVRQERVVL